MTWVVTNQTFCWNVNNTNTKPLLENITDLWTKLSQIMVQHEPVKNPNENQLDDHQWIDSTNCSSDPKGRAGRPSANIHRQFEQLTAINWFVSSDNLASQRPLPPFPRPNTTACMMHLRCKKDILNRHLLRLHGLRAQLIAFPPVLAKEWLVLQICGHIG